VSKLLSCRAAAAKCLVAVHDGASLSQQIPLFEARVAERDHALFRQLCYGSLRVFPRLAATVNLLLSKPLKNKDRDILMLIILGGYQLTDMRIPAHAALNTTVAASREFKKPWAKGLINGVLRQWQRQQDELLQQLSPAEQTAQTDWFYYAIKKAWPQQAQDIFEQNNQHPPMCLRINQLKTTRTDYLALLQQANIAADNCNYAPQGIRLQQAVAVNQLPFFSEGWVSVQDEAAQLAATLLAPQAEQRILDACCAPGGKTCHLLELEPNLGEVLALDIDEKRLERVTENLQRLQLNATLLAADAANIDSWWDQKPFDSILLDAPCSATGVIRRNPDIKLHRSEQDIQQLSQLQLEILTALWTILKPGGRILYATCSVLPQENEQVVAKFCQQQTDAKHLTINADWGIKRDFGRQLFPQANGHDGFFYALLEKPS
jgi:16S rRNA (cytosine967-C5)-methyltransferase